MGRKRKQISDDDLIDIQLKRKDIQHIIFQLEIYGVPLLHAKCNDETEKKNIKICRILERSITIYPKKYLISPNIKSINYLEKMKHAR